MNSKQIIDKAWSLAVEHVRQQLTKPSTVGIVTGLVNKELTGDDGLYVRRAMEELSEPLQRKVR